MITFIVIVAYLVWVISFFENIKKPSLSILLPSAQVVLVSWYVNSTWGVVSLVACSLFILYLFIDFMRN